MVAREPQPFKGASFKYLAASTIDERSGQTIFPAYHVKHFEGNPVAFIGLTLKDTPNIVVPSGVAGLYAVGRLAGTVVGESAGTQFALILGATAIHQAWSSLFELQGWSATPQLLARVGIAALATAVTGAAILMIARRVVGGPLFGNVSVRPGQAR